MKNETLDNVLSKLISNVLFNIHTIQPGKIDAYYGHTERKARVIPLVKLLDDKNNSYQIDPIDNVPVIFPSASSFNLLFPLKKDDPCLLLFSEVPLGNYLQGSGKVVDADDSNKFELANCICVPGLSGFRNVPNASTKIEIGDDDSITLETTTGKLKIEKTGNITFDDGTEPMVLGTVFDTWITSVLISIFNGHTHSSPAGGSTGTPSSPLTAPINYLSTFIKGK